MSESGSDRWAIPPSAPLRGSLRVPGDKSISHRIALLSLLSPVIEHVEGFLASEDCLCTLNAVAALGVDVTRRGTSVRLRGCPGAWRSASQPIDLGNSGTGMRLFSGIVAGLPVTVDITGDASLRSRPMKRIALPLAEMGAAIELKGSGGCAPIHIQGGKLHGIHYTLPVASAQVKSAVLLAGLSAEGVTTVVEPVATRDHTEQLLRAMGFACTTDGLTIRLNPAQSCLPQTGERQWRVPGDFSSAAFWMVAAAMRPGAQLEVHDVGLNPRRTGLVAVLRAMGAQMVVREDASTWEPRGTIAITGGPLRAVTIGGSVIPNVIDELPVLAVAAATAEGETIIEDAAELRVKESDRIATTVALLRSFGVDVTERDDGMVIRGPAELRGGASIDSGGDHRIAMAGAVLAMAANAPSTITNVTCVDTSYPGFKKQLDNLLEASGAWMGCDA